MWWWLKSLFIHDFKWNKPCYFTQLQFIYISLRNVYYPNYSSYQGYLFMKFAVLLQFVFVLMNSQALHFAQWGAFNIKIPDIHLSVLVSSLISNHTCKILARFWNWYHRFISTMSRNSKTKQLFLKELCSLKLYMFWKIVFSGLPSLHFLYDCYEMYIKG